MMKTERHTRGTEAGAAGRVLRIGEVARESGLSVETLRFYERRGLLGRPARTESNYRVYAESVLDQLAFIKRAQAVGFTLDEISNILAESTGGRLPCRAVREMARRKLDELDRRLAELHRHRRELAQTLAEWDERGEEPGHVCGLIEHSTLTPHAEHDAAWREAGRKAARRHDEHHD